MENVVLAIFDVESEAYQAFSELKNDSVNSAYTILQMAVVQNKDGRIVPSDGFDSGIDSRDDTYKGGLIGLVVGILGGPLGMLLGGATGALIGNIKDSSDVAQNSSLLEYISSELHGNQTGLVILIQESSEEPLDARLDKYRVVIKRWDAAKIADEVEQQQEMEKQMRQEAKARLKEQKKLDREAAIAAKRAKLKDDFEHVKSSTHETVQDAADTAKPLIANAVNSAIDKGSDLADKAIDAAKEKIDTDEA